ncbi:MAG: sigma-70 family RNA polymerase sigma factor [Bacteroidetes bacterium]|nr:sigma-70 family RNA polymerase sigma factor [Bacteroidota bacterium]
MTFIKNITTGIADAELVAAYKRDGDMEVLSNLYQRYMDLVYGVCLKYFENSDDAKDAVINIFEELVVKVRKYEIEHFKAWLYQLARNHCLMKLRSEKNKPRAVVYDFMYLEENIHLTEVVIKEEQFETMNDCMQQLPEEQKMAIEMFYLKENSYKTIAETTGTDINKIRSFIQNGRRNLKICMEKKSVENY